MRFALLFGFTSLGVFMATGCEQGSGGPGTGGTVSATGGTTSTGGLAGTGGVLGAGGASGGSNATGGQSSTGGGSAAGGADASGGEAGSGGGGAAASGGVAGSGGAGGAGGTGGGTFDTCGARSFLVCDGFETGEIDSKVWSVRTGGAADVVEVTTDEAARGSHSVHISTKNGYGFLENTSAFPIAGNDYFGRMFLRVAKFSTVDWAHWTVAEAAGNGDGSLIRVGGQYNTNQSVNRWGVGSDAGPTGDWTTHDADPPGAVREPPENEWVCLEWEHKGSANETHFYVDGTEHPSLATTATMHGGTSGVDYLLPAFTSLWFGFYQYQDDNSLTFDVWIDELAIDPQRIDCD